MPLRALTSSGASLYLTISVANPLAAQHLSRVFTVGRRRGRVFVIRLIEIKTPGCSPLLTSEVVYRSLLLALTLVAATSSPMLAQTLPIEPGDRVRVESEDVSGEFSIAEATPDALMLRADLAALPLQVPLTSLTRLEVQERHRNWLKGGLIGGGIGLVGGLLVHASFRNDPSCDDPVVDFLVCDTSSRVALIGFPLLGLGSGLLVGGLIVSERWEEVPLPNQLTVNPSRDGGVPLGYSVRF